MLKPSFSLKLCAFTFQLMDHLYVMQYFSTAYRVLLKDLVKTSFFLLREANKSGNACMWNQEMKEKNTKVKRMAYIESQAAKNK